VHVHYTYTMFMVHMGIMCMGPKVGPARGYPGERVIIIREQSCAPSETAPAVPPRAELAAPRRYLPARVELAVAIWAATRWPPELHQGSLRGPHFRSPWNPPFAYRPPSVEAE